MKQETHWDQTDAQIVINALVIEHAAIGDGVKELPVVLHVILMKLIILEVQTDVQIMTNAQV